jgi:TolB protein
VNGKDERQMTYDGGSHPHWSQNSEEIYFVGEDEDTCRVIAVSVYEDRRRVVATVPGRSPVLSPDGTRVLFSIGPWSETVLAVSSVDGSGLAQLAGGRSANSSVTSAWNGAWSRNGRKIAYTRGDSTGVLQVHMVGADGTGDRAMTRTTRERGSAQMPAWSPDGRRLAVQVSGGSRPPHIWIIDVATAEARTINVHEEDYADEAPAWFPDGDRLAFQSDRSGRMEVWIMRDDGSEPKQVTKRR